MRSSNSRVLSQLASLSVLSLALGWPTVSAAGEQEGLLLYDTYCISCHTTQVHWREKRLATDWITLKGQIDRWQLTIGQQWSAQQIDDVARYLNMQFYKFSPNAESRTQRSPRIPFDTQTIRHLIDKHIAKEG